VCSGQLSLLPSAGREMSSSLRATGWRPSVADWGGGISVVLHRWSNCPLSRAMDGRIMRRGIISSCQSAATSEIVKRCCSSLCKQRYSKYSDLYLFTFNWDGGRKKNFNRENLKFGLKFSVWASITSGLVGVSSRNFFRRRVATKG